MKHYLMHFQLFNKILRKVFKNSIVYSNKEKQNINEKFSKPRNYSQKKLTNFLKNPSYRITTNRKSLRSINGVPTARRYS